MKNAVIICEYNPFHNGHAYHIQKTRELTHCDNVICIMSGHFVQRGESAIADKYTRAEWAIRAGADVVVELPVVGAISNAQRFAQTAIHLANSLHADYLSFGAECADLDALTSAMNALQNETPAFKTAFSEAMKIGMTYPAARAQALRNVGQGMLADVISTPNNILAIEYLSALDRTHSDILPCVVARQGNQYNDMLVTSKYPSATALRELIRRGESVEEFVPAFVSDGDYRDIYQANENLYRLFRAKILDRGVDYVKAFTENADGLAHRIYEAVLSAATYDRFLTAAKNKSITMLRVKRLILAIMCDIIPSFCDDFTKIEPYFNVLAYCKEKKELLAFDHALLSSKDRSLLSPEQLSYLDKDVKADLLYHIIHELPYSKQAFYLTKPIR